MTTTTQAAGVPDGSFAAAPHGDGAVVLEGRPSPAHFDADPAGPARTAPAAISTLPPPSIGFAGPAGGGGRVTPIPPGEDPAADARPRRLPPPGGDRLIRFIPE